MDKNSLIVYVINLKSRNERRSHILNQFKAHEEFKVNIIDAYEHEIGAVGLWNTLKYIIKDAISLEEKFIIICEDDHQFTNAYNKANLFEIIAEVEQKGADILLGGVSGFEDPLQISSSLFWVDKFSGLQFTIIFRKFFNTILNTNFKDEDIPDFKLSGLTNNKFVIYPFISTQKEFGYSDVTSKNNTPGYVTQLFENASERMGRLLSVQKHYELLLQNNTSEEYDLTDISISAYVINLLERTERKHHTIEQFEHKAEFDLTIIEACKHNIGAVGLWQSIVKIVNIAINKDEDVIIIFEDDHEFTEHYSRKFLLDSIIKANELGANLLSGGIGNFRNIIPITEHLWWMDSFWSTQFIVIYKRFFQMIIDEPFIEGDTADGKFSEMTSNKMVIYPFISVQKDFGYSDICLRNNYRLDNTFKQASDRIKELNKISPIPTSYVQKQI